MTKTVDLTKVNLSPKAIVWTAIAFSVVITLYSVGQYGAKKLKDIMVGATKGLSDEVEDF